MEGRAILALCLGLCLLPGVPTRNSYAQRAEKIHSIGFLGAESRSYDQQGLNNLRANLRKLGYVEGRNLVIEARLAEGMYERLPELASELVNLNVEVIVADGVKATVGAKQATRTTPIVSLNMGDAVSAGLVETYSKPGGNVTGVAALAPETMVKRLELLKSADPRVTRVAVLVNPANPNFERYLRDLEDRAVALKVAIEPVVVSGADSLDAAFATIAEKRANAVIVHNDTLFSAHARRIADLVAQRRIASAAWPAVADMGFLIGYGFVRGETGPYVAVYVDKILKGAKPGDLPVQQPTKLQLSINLRTAKALGITIPQGLLLRADEVIQ